MNKIIISADSTCDMPKDLISKHNIQIMPLHIHIGEEAFRDKIDIFPEDIYKIYNEKKILPKTAAPSVGEFIEHFRPWIEDGYKVLHFSIGSGISSTHQNASLAASEFDGVYTIDSKLLSAGISILILKAIDLIESGKEIEEVIENIESLRHKADVTFVIDSLTFLREGGRLSALTAFGANLLNIKPCVKVSSEKDGQMDVVSKYRGNIAKIATKYIYDRLSESDDIDTSRLIIVDSGADESTLNIMKLAINDLKEFDEIIETKAGCTISSHCGENTISIIFLRK